MEFVIKPMEWWDIHSKGFVKKHYGSIPDYDKLIDYHNKAYSGYGQSKITNHTKAQPCSMWSYTNVLVLVACWNETLKRSEGRRILLAGRDTYQFNMLAEMGGLKEIDKHGHNDEHKVIFRPEISGYVSRANCIKENYKAFHLVDTGYAGSVPRGLKMDHYDLMMFSAANSTNGSKEQHQIFPKNNIVPYRVAGCMESSPKYWEPGEPSNGTAKQVITHTENFWKAALLSKHIAECLDRMLNNKNKASFSTFIRVGRTL